MEMQRREMTKDATMKVLVYEVALTRNEQYDVERIAKVLDS